jgi:hypothetical protein
MVILEATLSHVQQEKAKLEAENKRLEVRPIKAQSVVSDSDYKDAVSDSRKISEGRKLDFTGPSQLSNGTQTPKVSKSPKQ